MYEDKLYELKDKLMRELSEYAEYPKFSRDDAESIKFISSGIDHICNIMALAEEEEYSQRGGGRYSYEGGSRNYYDGRGGGNSGNYSFRGGSYAGGRSRTSRRDSTDRYSGDRGDYRYSRNMGGHSRAEEDMDSLIQELQGMAKDLPPEKQQEVQQFIQNMESMR